MTTPSLFANHPELGDNPTVIQDDTLPEHEVDR